MLLTIGTSIIAILGGLKLASIIDTDNVLYKLCHKIMSPFPQALSLLPIIGIPALLIWLLIKWVGIFSWFIPSFIGYGILSFLGSFVAILLFRTRKISSLINIFTK